MSLSEQAAELIDAGFTRDSQKRGLIRWMLGFSMALNVFLIYAYTSNSKAHEKVLHEIIQMQNKTEQKVDTTLKKL
ncbi:hypothetical protein ACFOWM_03445 [Ferruginibacter yonginensis]|uniref:Uncharacterized protein n=1 Tax=Ferruginibacter yonginensis TaxID=1310416 RepID=A0ABV8QQ35_9BACT